MIPYTPNSTIPNMFLNGLNDICLYVHGRSYGEFADFHQIHNTCLLLFLLSLYISPYVRKVLKMSANILNHVFSFSSFKIPSSLIYSAVIGRGSNNCHIEISFRMSSSK